MNRRSQNNKQSYESNNENQNLPRIQFKYLNGIFLLRAHDDYIEQFLFDSKSCLSSGVCLYIEDESLRRVTHNFTRDATRINCSKIAYLNISVLEKCMDSLLQEYFPCAKIFFF